MASSATLPVTDQPDQPTGSAAHLLASRLRLTMIRLARQLRRQDPSALTIAQLSALASVVRHGPLGVGALAQLEGLPSPAATRLADKLEEAGLVARRMNPADRRGVHLVATPEGTGLLARREQSGNAWLTTRLAALGETDRRAVERAIGVLEAWASEPVGEDPTADEDEDPRRAEVAPKGVHA